VFVLHIITQINQKAYDKSLHKENFVHEFLHVSYLYTNVRFSVCLIEVSTKLYRTIFVHSSNRKLTNKFKKKVSVFVNSPTQFMFSYVCVKRLPNWESYTKHYPTAHSPTLCVSVCVWQVGTGGQQWQANDVSHYNARVKSWILIKKIKKAKVESGAGKAGKAALHRDTKKEATCCLCECELSVCVASMINETVLNVCLTWPQSHTQSPASHRYSHSAKSLKYD